MKKIFTLLALIAIASMLSLGAKNIKTVEISPDNTLCDQVTPEFGDVDSLILTGFMNYYPDLKVIDSLATFHNLTGLNLSDCSMGDDALPPYALSSGFRKFIVDGEDVYQANHLYYVTLPNNLRILGECCFYYSTIKCIDIPNTVNELRINAFKGCRELESIVIPEGVSEVADECFCNCPKLRNVSLPSSCKRILSYAFAFNENLKTIRLPEGLEEIYPFSFFSSGLEVINIPSSVQTIYFQAFNDCKKIKTIYLHEGLQMFFMGYQFANLTSLESFYCDIKEPVLFDPGSDPFVGNDQTKAILYVPVGSKEKYEAAQYWQDFDNIVEMDMTGISTVNGDRQVTGVRYYNLAGVESAELQPGVNIKVTTYSNGTRTSEKIIK